MHTTAEDIIVKVIDGVENVLLAGTTREAMVTYLATRMFPFIHYRTGDVGGDFHRFAGMWTRCREKVG